MTDGGQASGSQLQIVAAIREELERAIERDHGARRSPRRRMVGLALAGALTLATAAGAASGALDVGTVMPGGAPTGSNERADETVLATGTTPVAGEWRMTSYTSKEFVHGGQVVERGGLPCVRLMLVDQRRSPLAGSGWCAEIEDGFHVASLPFADSQGRAEVILFGIAPEGAGGVELSADDGLRIRERTYPGPADFAGDVWVIAAPTALSNPTVDWIDARGRPAGADHDASGQLERGAALERAIEPEN
jgi:hypothetical protein